MGNRVFLPDRCEADVAVLAHELTHCAQYQAWGPLRYYARGVAVQLRHLLHRGFGWGRNPYAWEADDGRPFEAFGMEQQGQIVEDATRGPSRGAATADRYAAPSAWLTEPGGVSGRRSSQSASTFPSGSAIIAMMPHACWVGSATKRTLRSCSTPQ